MPPATSVVSPFCQTYTPPSGVVNERTVAPFTDVLSTIAGSCASCLVRAGVVLVSARAIVPKPLP